MTRMAQASGVRRVYVALFWCTYYPLPTKFLQANSIILPIYTTLSSQAQEPHTKQNNLSQSSADF